MQTIDYAYNIRGWLTKINDPNNLGSDVFALSINHTGIANSGDTPNYNGNMGSITWKNSSDDIERTYDFYYDNLNRLTSANYTQENPVITGLVSTTDLFNTTYNYDRNSNINTLTRKGRLSDGNFGDIDNLNYNYSTDGALSNITESSNKEIGFRSKVANGVGNFDYDDNGNMISDAHKSMSVTYNFLDLATNITKPEGTIDWIFDAAGNKLSKTVTTHHLAVNINPIFSKEYQASQTITSNGTVPTTGNVTFTAGQSITLTEGFTAIGGSDFLARILAPLPETREYVDGIEYFNEQLEAVYFSDGRVKYEGNNSHYEYVLSDDKGATRTLFKDDGNGTASVLEDYDYYPYGGQFEQKSHLQNNYTFGGTEQQTELDLDWQDVGVRCYDIWSARWQGIDMLAEYNAGYSPYSFTNGNPIRFSDPSGMISEDENGLMSVSTDLWGDARNQDFMNQSTSNASTRAGINQQRQAGYITAGAGTGAKGGINEWLADGATARDVDNYIFSAAGEDYVYNEYAGAEVSREIVENGTNITYAGMWISTGYLADFANKGVISSYQESLAITRLVFDNRVKGGTIGGLDLLGGGGPIIKASKTYSGALKKAMDWLFKRGFRAQKVKRGKFGDIRGKGIGMQTKNKSAEFRVEYDKKSGAHINVWNKKEPGPHFTFPAKESTVKKIQKKFQKMLGIRK